MITFILSAIGIYFLFLILDLIFRPRQKQGAYREGDFIKQMPDGNLYLVREIETEPDPAPEILPDNVVQIRANRK